MGKVNADPRLKEMNRDWSRTIRLEPTDDHSPAAFSYLEGTMEVLPEEGDRTADIVLMAPEAILYSVFSGASSPTEPYLEGTLKVLGTQEDVIRLDFLSLMIWGE